MSEILIPNLDTAAPAAPATAVRPLAAPAKPDKAGFIWGTGRRKTAVARVRIKPGSGKFEVKGRDYKEYFSEPQHRDACVSPLRATDTNGKLDVFVNVAGGGITGQADAVKMGLARALKGWAPELEGALRAQSLLSRDDRKVERKKPGRAGARRRFQFSKR